MTGYSVAVTATGAAINYAGSAIVSELKGLPDKVAVEESPIVASIWSQDKTA
ncbi:MAG: hypothetical protein ACHP6H_02165 [Legionellales bacterium]